jgi:serine/threonine-protein kinase RsbW
MTSYKLSCQFQSTLEEVDAQVNALLESLDEKVVEYDRFSLDLILREALNNAVIHGNKNNPDLVIFLSIMLIGKWFHIRIEDQGEGFDWTSGIQRTEVEANAEHGRGFPIILHYGEQVQLNEKGNKISFKLARFPRVK